MTAQAKKTPAPKADPETKVNINKSESKPAANEPFHALMTPFEELENAFERAYGRLFPRGWLRPSRWEFPRWGEFPMPFEGKHPRVDVIDHDDKVVVKAELPGVEKKDLDVTMSDNTVTIKGSVSHEKEETKGDYYRREMSSGSFSRTVVLPSEVDGARADANYKDGVLELTLPKIAKAKRRKVDVK